MEALKGRDRSRLLKCLIEQEQAFAKYAPNLSRLGMLIFYTVARSPGMSQVELGEALDLHKRTISGVVKSLVLPEKPRHALVCYHDDPSGDRRKKRLHLTKRGDKLITELVSIFQSC